MNYAYLWTLTKFLTFSSCSWYHISLELGLLNCVVLYWFSVMWTMLDNMACHICYCSFYITDIKVKYFAYSETFASFPSLVVVNILINHHHLYLTIIITIATTSLILNKMFNTPVETVNQNNLVEIKDWSKKMIQTKFHKFRWKTIMPQNCKVLPISHKLFWSCQRLIRHIINLMVIKRESFITNQTTCNRMWQTNNLSVLNMRHKAFQVLPKKKKRV